MKGTLVICNSEIARRLSSSPSSSHDLSTTLHAPNIRQQSGQALLLTVLLLGAVASLAVFSLLSPRNTQIENSRRTEASLAMARDALIGYAVQNTTRPGNLPCPDRTGNGQQTTPCTSGSTLTRIGFLPWKTLGTGDLRDGTGAPLLYAVSNVFAGSASMLNSDTGGEYVVGGTTSASDVIAIVFAPGVVTSTQQRDSTTAFCVTTGTFIARNICPANYLEGGNENGDINFTTGPFSNIFNDQLLLITQENFFPAVTSRVAREVRTALNDYYLANNRFPNAASFSDSTSTCDSTVFQGRLPLTSIIGCTALPPYPAVGSLLPWFSNNSWQDYIFYAVSPLCTSSTTVATCLATGGLNIVGASANAGSLVIISGRALIGQARPCAIVSDCFEDAGNIDGDNVFQQPTLSTSNNDRLVIVAP